MRPRSTNTGWRNDREGRRNREQLITNPGLPNTSLKRYRSILIFLDSSQALCEVTPFLQYVELRQGFISRDLLDDRD